MTTDDIEPSSRSSVIVVDEDDMVLIAVGDMFAKHEFYVVEATNAEDAIDVLNADAHNIEILFADIHMHGGMNGIDLARYVQRNWPWIQIILTSGNTKPEILPEGVDFIEKTCDFESVIPLLRRNDGEACHAA